MTLYIRRRTLAAGGVDHFQVNFVAQKFTVIGFAAKNPSFKIVADPLIKLLAGSGGSLPLQVDTGFVMPLDFNWGGGEVDFIITETGGVANEYTLFISTDPTSITNLKVR